MERRGATPRIFISYSHDTTTHKERVLSLSERLRRDGIETSLDRYVNGAPAEGWPRWMLNQIDSAEFILLVCTETYYRRFRGREEPGKGKGVAWEGAVITQELYDAHSATIKFVPVLFEATDERFIPEPVRGHTFYVLNSEQAYQDLYDFLLEQAGIEPGPVGEPKWKPRVRAKLLGFEGEGGELGQPSVLDHSNLKRILPAKVDSGAREGAGRNDDQGRRAGWKEPSLANEEKKISSEERRFLESLLTTHERNQRVLEQQIAQLGAFAPPFMRTQLEDENAAIEDIRQKLRLP